MDRDKLNKAAKYFAAWETINSSERMSNFYCSLGFSKGADWLMQQPLSERLTEEEKEKISEAYQDYIQIVGLPSGRAVCNVLTAIFDTDLFNQPTAI